MTKIQPERPEKNVFMIWNIQSSTYSVSWSIRYKGPDSAPDPTTPILGIYIRHGISFPPAYRRGNASKDDFFESGTEEGGMGEIDSRPGTGRSDQWLERDGSGSSLI
uniref:Uncharacterized protein n=1 Tax=Romanomermis culicivorax TaxID=13658 RepID=A0A915IGF0_ROMCU